MTHRREHDGHELALGERAHQRAEREVARADEEDAEVARADDVPVDVARAAEDHDVEHGRQPTSRRRSMSAAAYLASTTPAVPTGAVSSASMVPLRRSSAKRRIVMPRAEEKSGR